MTAHIGLKEEQIDTVVLVLKKVLGTQRVLLSKVKQFHRNLTGMHFIALHELYDEFAATLTWHIDKTAERIRMLWKVSSWTLAQFLQNSILEEHQEVTLIESKKTAELLLQDYETFIKDIRASVDICSDAHDEWNADFLIWVMKEYEKNAWMLRSSIA